QHEAEMVAVRAECSTHVAQERRSGARDKTEEEYDKAAQEGVSEHNNMSDPTWRPPKSGSRGTRLRLTRIRARP
ncbi:hypothetical protein VIGAN_01205200, partial [Vigna angularis var. angularis]